MCAWGRQRQGELPPPPPLVTNDLGPRLARTPGSRLRSPPWLAAMASARHQLEVLVLARRHLRLEVQEHARLRDVRTLPGRIGVAWVGLAALTQQSHLSGPPRNSSPCASRWPRPGLASCAA